MPDSTTMGIERKVKDVAPSLGHEINEFRTPTEDSVYADLLHEARELSNSTFVVPLRIAKDRLGNVVNDIRDGIFAHGVVVPVSGPETGHFEPQAGPGQVFANPNMVVDGSFGDGVDMTISRMHKVEAAAVKFVPLAQAEYRLEALRKFLEITGQSSVYDPQSETHLNAGQIEARLADLKVSYRTHYEDFVADVTGKKVEGPKTAKEGKRTRIMAPPVRIVDEAPGHVAQVSPDVEAWYRNIDLKRAGLATAGVLAALSGACAAATPIAPAPINFATPTETAVIPSTPTAEPTQAATPTEIPTKVPTKTAEPTATETRSEEEVVRETLGLPEGNYSFYEFDQGGLKKTYFQNEQGGVVGVLSKEGWETLADTEKRLTELHDEQGSYLNEKIYKQGLLIVYAEHSGEFSVKDVPISEGVTAKVSHLVYILTEKGLVPLLVPTVLVLEDGRWLSPVAYETVYDAPFPQNEMNTWILYLRDCCDSGGYMKDDAGFAKGKLVWVGLGIDKSRFTGTTSNSEASKIREKMVSDYYGGLAELEKFRKDGVWDFGLLVNDGVTVVEK